MGPGRRRLGRLPGLAAELVALRVDVIVAVSTPAIVAAKQATGTIPIVMPFSGDPVGSGLVASLERPGGNVTGLTNLGPGAQGKRLGLLAQVAPGASRLAFVTIPLASNPAVAPSLAATREAAGPLGVGVVPVEVPEPGAFSAAFDRMRDEGAGGFIFYYAPFPAPLRDQAFGLALERRLPGVYETREVAQAGGLMAYGPNVADLYRRAGGYVDQILKGADPAELAIGLPEKYDLAVNLTAAQALGLTIPPSVLSQATELFQ